MLVQCYGFCDWSSFCDIVIYVFLVLAVISLRKGELVAFMTLCSLLICVLLFFCSGCLVCDLRLWRAWPRGYRTFFMLNSTEHELSIAHKN